MPAPKTPRLSSCKWEKSREPLPSNAKIVSEKTANAKPAVTVIVTLYNYAQYVGECLTSIAEQTQQNKEIVVVDDCSEDGGLNFVTDWIVRNEDVFVGHKIITHATNMGLPYARNTAFEHARADRIFVMDADNALYPRAIERCMQSMTESGAAGAYTQLEFFGDRARRRRRRLLEQRALQADQLRRRHGACFQGGVEKVGGYSQLNVSGWEDYDFWCEFVEQDLYCAFVPELLCRYRTHAGSMSATETNPNAGALILQMSIRHPWLEFPVRPRDGSTAMGWNS